MAALGNHAWPEDSKEPRYPFGFGPSYMNFALEKMTVEVIESFSASACFTVRDTGDVDGVCIPQMYVTNPVSPVVKPNKWPCAFERVTPKAGETR